MMAPGEADSGAASPGAARPGGAVSENPWQAGGRAAPAASRAQSGTRNAPPRNARRRTRAQARRIRAEKGPAPGRRKERRMTAPPTPAALGYDSWRKPPGFPLRHPGRSEAPAPDPDPGESRGPGRRGLCRIAPVVLGPGFPARRRGQAGAGATVEAVAIGSHQRPLVEHRAWRERQGRREEREEARALHFESRGDDPETAERKASRQVAMTKHDIA